MLIFAVIAWIITVIILCVLMSYGRDIIDSLNNIERRISALHAGMHDKDWTQRSRESAGAYCDDKWEDLIILAQEYLVEHFGSLPHGNRIRMCGARTINGNPGYIAQCSFDSDRQSIWLIVTSNDAGVLSVRGHADRYDAAQAEVSRLQDEVTS